MTGPVVTDLLRQANAIGRYADAARAMTRAAIDFMLASPRWSHHASPARLVPIKNGWRLNSCLLYVLPNCDDEAIIDLEKRLPKAPRYMELLVPPWAAVLFRHAVDSAFVNRRVSVISVDSFCDLRLLWTGLDMQQSHQDCLLDLLRRYRLETRSNPEITIMPLLPPCDDAEEGAEKDAQPQGAPPAPRTPEI